MRTAFLLILSTLALNACWSKKDLPEPCMGKPYHTQKLTDGSYQVTACNILGRDVETPLAHAAKSVCPDKYRISNRETSLNSQTGDYYFAAPFVKPTKHYENAQSNYVIASVQCVN